MTRNDINGRILGLEMELSLLEQDLEVAGADKAWFEKCLADVEYTVEFLKTKAAIVSLQEFKKIIVDHKAFSKELLVARKKSSTLEKTTEEKLKQLNDYYDLYEKEFKDFNILEFKRNE